MFEVNPSYYTKGRIFQPIQVIDDWSLCHHLACVVKYISRAGRKEEVLPDLKKAEWYLQRELVMSRQSCNNCQSESIISLEAVIADWQLSAHLGEVLVAIKYSSNRDFSRQLLEKALHNLRSAISIQIIKGETR